MAQPKKAVQTALADQTNVSNDLLVCRKPSRAVEPAFGQVLLPEAQHLPGFSRWMWDGECCGSIGFRWQPGTDVLPPHYLGHIGYAVVPCERFVKPPQFGSKQGLRYRIALA